jgi:hypothetical protein
MWLLVSNQAGSVDPPPSEVFLLAQSAIPAEKIEAYRKTDYRFGHGTDLITLRINTRSEALSQLYISSGYTCGAFITAYNPCGQAKNIETNETAHAQLREKLHTLSPIIIEGAGTDPTGDWPEEKSFLALGIDLETAKSLGICYEQDAIVWVGTDAVPQLILLR